MANKLAGQRAKFSRALADYRSSDEESRRSRAVQLMAEVLADAPDNGFTEDQVTQGADVPDEVRRFLANSDFPPRTEEDPTNSSPRSEPRSTPRTFSSSAKARSQSTPTDMDVHLTA